MKLLTKSGWRGRERYRWFVGRRTAPGVDNKPRVRDLKVPRRAAVVASALNATSEDRFVKSKRSFDVGDGEKVRDGNAVLLRHLIAFLLDLYLVHRQLQFGYGISQFARSCIGSIREIDQSARGHDASNLRRGRAFREIRPLLACLRA